MKASREQLLAIVDEWALARRVESFFEDAGCSASRLPPSEASAVNSKLERARQLLGGVDSLRHFGAWRAPEERVPEERHEERLDGESQLAE
ncbi:MAG TPA: hypothetical protein VLN08_16720 [Vicinamibacterales bacterium]|nr:hypothetical protein [Vicinamibacterales bacterium]